MPSGSPTGWRKGVGRRSATWFALSLTLLAGVGGEGPQAETKATAPLIQQLQVAVWPEYDDPRVLVILRGTFASNVRLPVPVSLGIPSDAQVVGAGRIGSGGELLLVPYALEGAGEARKLVMTVPDRSFFMEYYYQNVTGSRQRVIQFAQRFEYPVATLILEVQQPLRTTSFAVVPAPQERYTDNEGFQYQRYRFTNVAAGQSVSLKVSYEKDDSHPSKTMAASPPGGQVTGSASVVAPTGPRPLSAVAWVLAAVALFSLALNAYLILERRRSMPREKQRGQFCTGCGALLEESVRFCPECGKKVK